VNVGTGYFNAVTNATAGGGTNERTCVKERPTSDRYTDAPPGAGNFFAYYSGSGVCEPTSTITPLTSDKAVLTAHIDSMPTTGMTAGHLGTAWAWYLISPRWASIWPSASMPNSYSMLTESSDPGSSAAPGDPDFKPKLHKIAILMTDGAYNKYYSGSSSTVQARSICDEIKTTGVVVYTVGFQIAVGSEPDVTMQQCATSTSHYYNASTGEALKQAFRDIALKIADLRIAE
ncbi:MAG: VWA domain-containing protein, partial [Hyphomicrobiaceae bacterium]